jgi:hypothetical protein
MKMETWSAEVPAEQLSKMGELTVKYEFLSKTPDIDAMVVR